MEPLFYLLVWINKSWSYSLDVDYEQKDSAQVLQDI